MYRGQTTNRIENNYLFNRLNCMSLLCGDSTEWQLYENISSMRQAISYFRAELNEKLGHSSIW